MTEKAQQMIEDKRVQLKLYDHAKLNEDQIIEIMEEYARHREMELLDRVRIYKQISVIGTAKMLTNEVLLADIIETT